MRRLEEDAFDHPGYAHLCKTESNRVQDLGSEDGFRKLMDVVGSKLRQVIASATKCNHFGKCISLVHERVITARMKYSLQI